ncbi:hypothetical protein HYV91_01855 [Candidatus Wolfebacteria bacterium]|nr:hypothetical protein [Candidatus Wolfebacteria bacterium]
MKSKWFRYKDEAIRLRKKGFSIGNVEKCLGIPRSTLSGWFKDVKLSEKQKHKLWLNWKNGLTKARKKAVLWHNQQKQNRLNEAREASLGVLRRINLKDKDILDLALAMLYLGEGAKKNAETAMGSSDPLILRFFIAALRKIYNFDISKMRCELYLRADQNPDVIKRFWSSELNLPIRNFKQVSIDKRTIGIKTYPGYKGVCNIRCSNVAIKRKLLYLSELFIKKFIS